MTFQRSQFRSFMIFDFIQKSVSTILQRIKLSLYDILVQPVQILHDDLHLKPYRFHQWRKLKVHDYEKRVNFANWFFRCQWILSIFFICSDKTYFYLTLPINKQNNRNWCESPPYEKIQIHLHDEKVLVWCAISAKRIFAPYFFKNAKKYFG